MRIWLLEQVESIERGLKGFLRVLVERADKEKDYLLPGYTHLQVCLKWLDERDT
jgi:argininosuccinate lyase